MSGPFAAALGSIAFATVLLRGVISGESPGSCIYSGLVWMGLFFVIGWIAGSIMDYLVRQDVEDQYRRRLQRFREEVEAMNEQKPMG